jgi:hypothetical protein
MAKVNRTPPRVIFVANPARQKGAKLLPGSAHGGWFDCTPNGCNLQGVREVYSVSAYDVTSRPGKYCNWPLDFVALLVTAFAVAADPPIPPVTVCEILADLPAHEGKDVAVLGRYSFRRDGRWIGEQSCEPATAVRRCSG